MNDDDIDVEGEFGFEPAVSATGAPAEPARVKRAPKRRGRFGRRLGTSVVLLAALTSMGSIYAAFAANSGASATGMSAEDIEAGRQLFSVSCITCHGANLDGVRGQGPSLIGVGGASVYFQVSTGRMPLAQQGAYGARKPAKFNEEQIQQLAAYVESVGGGPILPQGTLRGDDSSIALGGELFRLNCASCHGATGGGAPLSAGNVAPTLREADDKQIVAAMLSGPENMPVFSDNQLTPEEKKAIVAYIQFLNESKDPGGHGIDRIGPVSEAIVLWVGGVGAIMIAILWIGARNR